MAVIIAARQPARAADTIAPGSFVFPSGSNDVALPAQIRYSNGEIVVRMTINGRGYDMLLDTGSPSNALDHSVVERLGLAVGSDKSFVFDEVAFGDVKVRQLRFFSRSFYRQREDGTTIVGIVGYDFLRNAVVKIDYDRGTVNVIEPSSFREPAEGTAQFALQPSSRVPVIAARIGNAEGASFVVDSGATTVVVFPRLAKNYPDEFTPKQELQDTGEDSYFRSFWPSCGKITQKPYAVSAIAVGAVGIRDWAVWKPDDNSCFNPEGLDGLLGYDFLRLFTLYVDYPSNRIIFEPNDRYKTAPNTFKL